MATSGFALFVPQGIGQRGFLRDVDSDGKSVVFTSKFSNIKVSTGDYRLEIDGYDSEDEEAKESVEARFVKTPFGFSVFPKNEEETIAFLTWEAEPFTEQTPSSVPTAEFEVTEGSKIFDDVAVLTTAGVPQLIPFTGGFSFDSVDDYNVSYVRGYREDDAEVVVPITSIIKQTNGILITSPEDNTVVEWGIRPRL